MSKQAFLPESLYSIDEEMNHKKLSVFYENESPITGKVIRLDSEKQLLQVSIGGGLIANMPYDKSTIYSIFKEDGSVSHNVLGLLGKNIQAKIFGFEGNKVILSRKENMLEALEYFKNNTEVKFAEITNFSQKSAFIDIGAGIIGRSYAKNFSTIVFSDIKDIGFNKGDLVSVKILEHIEETQRFNLSRVACLPSVDNIINEDDVIVCKVFNKTNDPDGIGYYVLIDNCISGIIDSDIELEYGDEVVAVIKRLAPKGPHLKLVEKL